MARIVFAMNLSLDGYVDHDRFAPDPVLFRHWIQQVRRASACLYGRRLYEIMRYWDEDRPEWTADQRDFAVAWRRLPKWVASRSLAEVGPNATLVPGDIGAFVRGLKAGPEGEIDVGGPVLAGHLSGLGLIDEYRLYLHPVVLGQGRPFFTGPRPPLRIQDTDRIGDSVVRLTCVPA
ncbi:MAG: dihydrofolate reductase family protein [Gemmobacter sp.]